MTLQEIEKCKGKIIAKDNQDYVWLFKVLDVRNINSEKNVELTATQGMDVYPIPRAYRGTEAFNKPYREISVINTMRMPTKAELNLYRKYSRELKLLGTNKSNYGKK